MTLFESWLFFLRSVPLQQEILDFEDHISKDYQRWYRERNNLKERLDHYVRLAQNCQQLTEEADRQGLYLISSK